MYPITVGVTRRVGASRHVKHELAGQLWLAVVRTVEKVSILPIGKTPRRKEKVAATSERPPIESAVSMSRRLAENVIGRVEFVVAVTINEHRYAKVPSIPAITGLLSGWAHNHVGLVRDGRMPGIADGGAQLVQCRIGPLVAHQLRQTLGAPEE